MGSSVQSRTTDATRAPLKKNATRRQNEMPDIQHFFKAAQTGDTKYFQDLNQQYKPDKSWLSKTYPKSGDTVLHYAAQFGHHDLVSYLISQGADLEKANFDGKRPLHDAAQNGHLECVKVLIEAGANVDSLKRADWTPLMLACTKANLEVVKTLVEHGAKLHLMNKDGWNPFHIACRSLEYSRKASIIELLEVNMVSGIDPLGPLVIHIALHGYKDAMTYLLDNCLFTVDTRDSCGSTPFMDALRSGHVDVARILMSKQKVDVYCEDNFGYQALHLAVQTGHLASVKYLVEECSLDANDKSQKGFSPLAVAAKEGQLDVMKYLVSKWADVNMTDDKGRTALHIAAGAQHAECCQYLLQGGAKIVADVNGVKPQDLARKQHVLGIFEAYSTCATEEHNQHSAVT